MVAKKGQAAVAWAEAKSHFSQSKSRSSLLFAAAVHYEAEAAWQKAALALPLATVDN